METRTVCLVYTNQSASTIAEDLLRRFAPGFTWRHVDPELPIVDVISFTNVDLADALTQLAKRIGGYWRVDYFGDLWFGLTESDGTQPIALTAAHPTLSEFASSTTIGDIITRCLVEGGGSTALSAIAAGGAAQVLTNPNFTGDASGWTLGAGWAYGTSDVVHTAASGVAPLRQDVILVPGQRYVVTVTLDAGTTGSGVGVSTLIVGGTFVDTYIGTDRGPYTKHITALDTSGVLFTPSSGFDGSITTLSVTEESETILPVDDVSWYNPAGGTVVCGSQRITYAGVTTGGGGTVVGSGAAPTVAPLLAIASGAGVDAGVHRYAVVFGTAAGKSLPGPAASITTAVTVAPTAPGYTVGPNGFASGLWAVGDTVEFKCSYSVASSATDYTHETATGPSTGVQTLVYYPPDHAFIYTPVITVPYSSDPTVKWVHVWCSHNGGAFVRVYVQGVGVAQDAPNIVGGSTYLLPFTAQLLSDTIPSPNTANEQVSVTPFLGPTGTTYREFYRTVAGGSQLKLQHTISDNTTTTPYTDSMADASLGADAPTSDTSGLTQPSGQVLPGAVALPIAGSFPISAGWAVIGNGEQAIRFSGKSGGNLTGIPATGPGAITATVSFNSTITAAPCLTGIPATGTGSILYAINKGDPVNLLVQVDDAAAQSVLSDLLDPSNLLGGAAGIREDYIQDGRISETEARARGTAQLALMSRAQLSVTYTVEDPLTASGRTISINLPVQGVTSDLTIQRVTTTNFREAATFFPDYAVEASSVRMSFDDLLRLFRAQLNG